MRMNNSMNELLKKYLVQNIEDIPQTKAYRIWDKKDRIGRIYWGVSSFWGMDKHAISSEQDLSQLEWHGNEVYLEAHTDKNVSKILRNAIGILKFWKKELESKYPDTPFYLFAFYDNGGMLILDEGEAPVRSVNLRFWADRGDNAVVDFSDFDEWEQPAIIEQCNFR